MKTENRFIICIVLLLNITASSQNPIVNHSGSIYIHTGAQMAVFGDFSNNGVIVDSGNVVLFCGSAAQSIGGSSQTVFRNLAITNASGVSLFQNTSVSNTLSLNSGALFLNTRTLSILSGSVSAITRATGYIVSEQNNNSGIIKWNIGNTPGAHIFPFGNGVADYIPVSVTVTSGNIGNIKIATYATGFNNLPFPVTPVAVTNLDDINGNDNSANTVDRFWQTDIEGAGGVSEISFTASPTEIGALTLLKAQQWNAVTGGWDLPSPAQSASGQTVTVTGVTNYTPWAISGNGAALPIHLLSFTATAVQNTYTDIRWTTASETNNDYFIVQKTRDGINFETVCLVNGAGTSSTENSYQAFDYTPYMGTSYYRLIEVDNNGLHAPGNYAMVDFSAVVKPSAIIYPNPGNGNAVLVMNGVAEQEVRIMMTDIDGRILYTKEYTSEFSHSEVSLPFADSLSAGVYVIHVGLNTENLTLRLIVK